MDLVSSDEDLDFDDQYRHRVSRQVIVFINYLIWYPNKEQLNNGKNLNNNL